MGNEKRVGTDRNRAAQKSRNDWLKLEEQEYKRIIMQNRKEWNFDKKEENKKSINI